MYEISGELTVILINVRWLQKSGKYGQEIEKTKRFDVERFYLRKLSELEVGKKQLNSHAGL